MNFSIKMIFPVLCRVAEVLDYSPDELVGESLYSLCHAEDASMLKKAHSDCKFGENYFL